MRKLRSRDQVSPLRRNSVTEINNEIEVLEKLNHKNIIKMIENKIVEDKQYIVLEYCEQESLQDILEKTPNIEE